MDNELEQLGERIAEQAAHLDAAMHRLLADLRAFDARGGWYAQGAASCAHWLAWRVGWDLVTARDHVRVARKLAEFPAIDDALRCGEVSYSKVRAMLRVATSANEVLLLEHAKLMTASQLEKLCRRYALVQRHGEDRHPQVDEQRRYVRRRDTEDGMVKIEAVLHPEEAEMVWAMLDHAAAQLVHGPGSCSGSGSAESGAVSRLQATLTGPLPAPAAMQSVHEPSSGSSGDSAESGAVPRTQATLTGPLPAPAAMQSVHEPSSGSSGDSAESGAVPRTHVTLTGLRLAPAVVDGANTAAGVAHDGMATAILLSIKDASEPLAEASPATRSEVVSVWTAVSGSDGGPDTAACVIDDRVVAQTLMSPIDDSVKSAELGAVAFTQLLTDVPQRSLLEQLLDEADALRGVGEAAHDVMSDLRDAGCELGSAEAARSGSDAAGDRRKAASLRDRAAAARKAFSRADALVAMAQGYLRSDRPERSPVEVVVTIPASSLRAGAALDPVEVGEMGESFLSGETARRLSCDAGVVDIVQDENGTPLSVGRKRRTIAGALQRALRKRDNACTFPGCTNRIFLEGHHIQHWADGGETSLQNTALLCTLHHRYVHEYGYVIELGPDQRPRFRDPHGRWVAAAPERPRVADLGWPQIRAENAALEIDADTIAGPWDGTPVDYGRIVGHLAVADGLA